MKVGVFVTSKTGNTLSVAENLKQRLLADGHSVSLEHVAAANANEMDMRRIRLVDPPSIVGYDLLVFAAPVNGFRPALAMQVFMKSLPSMQDRLAVGFVTQAFPFQWMGGVQALAVLEKLIAERGGKLSAQGVVNWSSRKRSQQIASLIETIAALLAT